MLVITRKNGQKIMINDNITVTIVEARNGQCKVAIEADKDVKIYREEIYYQIKLANLVGKNANVNAIESVSDLIKEEKLKLNDIVKSVPENDDVILEDKKGSKTFIIKKKNNNESN